MVKKFLFKKYKKELFFTLALLIGVILLLNRINQAGISILLLGAILYFYLKFVKKDSGELGRLKQELENQKKEIEDLKNRRIQVAGMKPILEVGLLEIDTHFTRTWNEKYDHEGKNLHFIGAMQIKLKAKYGVNLKDLSYFIDHENKVINIYGLKPKFLSFSEINHEWKIAEMMEHKKMPWIISNYWKKSQRFQDLLTEKMENKRKGVYEEIKQGPEEIRWLTEPLYQQVENTIRILLNRGDYQVLFTEDNQLDYQPLENYFLNE
jgi:hypothetical protein